MLSKKDKNNLRCALIFLGPFPIGNVSTIRVISYCKALAKKGVFIKVLILAPTREASINNKISGVFDGVHFQYMSKITWSNTNPTILVKGYYYLIGIIKTLKYIKKDNINCLLSYHSELFSNFFYWVITRILSIPFIIDKTEYPYGYNKMSSISKKIEKKKLHFYDGFIVISDELKTFYEQIKPKVFHLPMTIDTARFKGYERSKVDNPYIAVVFGVHNRDGLYESVVAYNKYSKLADGIILNLVLIGNYEKLPDKKKIDDFIQNNNLENKIEIKGLVNINKVPQILIDADCLLTTPNEYISGGFPTKLGEYMLSGVPIVATRAGEVGNYVTHKEDILISEPGDLDSVAMNILYTQQNRAECLVIAKNAKKRAAEVFNADCYADSLTSFLNYLRNRNRTFKHT